MKEEKLFEYKCINCGNIKELSKGCSCSECGYKMYPTPYEKREVLIGEINGFLRKLELSEIKDGDFVYVGKGKDEKRFPSYAQIHKNACSAERTEIYINRVELALEQISKYIHAEFNNRYVVDYAPLKQKIDQLESVLKQAFSKCNVEATFEEICIPNEKKEEKNEVKQFTWPETKLIYKEIPDEELCEIIDELLALLKELLNKIRKFIKVNNIYGNIHKNNTVAPKTHKKDVDYKKELHSCINSIDRIISKKYVVDISSDGTEELEEMYNGLWKAIAEIMNSPMLKAEANYQINGDTIVSKDEFFSIVLNSIQDRYNSYNSIVKDYYSSKTEDELFDLYDEFIQLDVFGFMGIKASELIRIEKSTYESEKKLNELIGLTTIKDSILKIKAYTIANKKKGEPLNIHMSFYGNPGTGKTEVARIIAGILYENKILPTKKLIEVDRSGLVGEYVGETPQKTMEVVRRAMGGVLFIDEAYALVPSRDGGFDYGHEAIATLLKAMEDYRGEFCVIMAGYKNPMKRMIDTNPGLKSRIQFELDFPNYSRDELRQITDSMLTKREYVIGEAARERLLDITDYRRKDPNFANAREIRNILDQVIMCQNVRCIGSEDNEIGIADINKYIADSKIPLPVSKDNRTKTIMTAEEELDALIGLYSVKRMVKKIKAYAKRNTNDEGFNLHMVFTGNPGTGKTEVARIISRILYDAGVLPEAKLVETDARGLIGQAVGETAPKTEGKIEEAMGGVLFIDEAYMLSSGQSDVKTADFGEEAISVLLKEMEDRRGQFCVVLAGYQDEMKNMLSSNPGFESRIQFKLDFQDYSREELGEITQLFLAKKNYKIDQDALERILDLSDWCRRNTKFANARTIRNIIDQVILNQNLRIDESGEDDDALLIIKSDVDEYIQEEGLMKSEKKSFGFNV